jgi:hypothetical protein
MIVLAIEVAAIATLTVYGVRRYLLRRSGRAGSPKRPSIHNNIAYVWDAKSRNVFLRSRASIGNRMMTRADTAGIVFVCLLSVLLWKPPAAMAATAQPQVHISALSPSSGAVGTQVTVTGSGFTHDNTVLFGSGAMVHLPSDDGLMLVFTVPQVLNALCYYSGCKGVSLATRPGDYPVSVQNENGTSNAVTFTVR